MADLYQDIPELAAQEAAIKRRQRIAETLMKQSLTPMATNEMAGQYVVRRSPLEGLAKVLQAYNAKSELDSTDQEYKDLAKQRQQNVTDVLAQSQKLSQGTPAVMGNVPVPQPSDRPDFNVQQGEVSPAVAGDSKAAIASLLASPYAADPRLQYALGRITKTEDFNSEAGLKREQWAIEAKLKKEELAQKHVDKLEEIAEKEKEGRITKEEAAARTAAENIANDKRHAVNSENLLRVAASLRPAPAEQPLETVMLNGVPTLVSRKEAIGKPAVVKGGKGSGMSTAAQKELFDTDDAIEGANQAIKSFDKALLINKSAMGFTGAGVVASAGSLLPEAVRPNVIDATQELDNILQDSALPQLKAIFGGMPTEGERAVLLEVQGSSSKPPKVREGIFKRAKKAAERRVEFNKQKAKQLREGTYFSGDGGIDSTEVQPSIDKKPARRSTDKTSSGWSVVK